MHSRSYSFNSIDVLSRSSKEHQQQQLLETSIFSKESSRLKPKSDDSFDGSFSYRLDNSGIAARIGNRNWKKALSYVKANKVNKFAIKQSPMMHFMADQNKTIQVVDRRKKLHAR